MKRFGLVRAVTAAAVALAAVTASTASIAGPLYASYDNFNYSGTVTRYASLADAQNGVNALSSTSIATANNGPRSTLPNARDGQIYVASGATGYDPTNLAYMSTAWYFTTTPASGNGWGNPNNTNNGFIQYYDDTANPVVDGGWSNGYTRFTVNISGGDGDSGNFARLWPAPNPGGPAGDSGGVFRSFDMTLTADFAVAASLNGVTGWYETNAMPFAALGSATGIFENQSTTDTSLNGFYTFDFSFAPGSWADANGAVWVAGQDNFGPGAFFAAPEAAAVPEPAGLALVGLGLAALAATRRRKSA